MVVFVVARKPLRSPMSFGMTLLGVFGGMCMGVLSTSQRFMGLKPNAHEVLKYGVMSPERVASLHNRTDVPNWDLIHTDGEDEDEDDY
jgi:hypothetical protein